MFRFFRTKMTSNKKIIVNQKTLVSIKNDLIKKIGVSNITGPTVFCDYVSILILEYADVLENDFESKKISLIQFNSPLSKLIYTIEEKEGKEKISVNFHFVNYINRHLKKRACCVLFEDDYLGVIKRDN